MSFEKMQDITYIHERSCMIAYGFSTNELKTIQTVARLAGIKDIIHITEKNAMTSIGNILDDQLSEDVGEIPKEKAIILNNVATNRMNAFIEGLKKMRISRPLIAVVTEHSINWSLRELIINLTEERMALKNNQ
ncbi:MAG: DUF3783 domain-containing protein, partial [Clostridium sp.]|nr:DUF3783 domain-containing protein [Clostridium sp.]